MSIEIDDDFFDDDSDDFGKGQPDEKGERDGDKEEDKDSGGESLSHSERGSESEKHENDLRDHESEGGRSQESGSILEEEEEVEEEVYEDEFEDESQGDEKDESRDETRSSRGESEEERDRSEAGRESGGYYDGGNTKDGDESTDPKEDNGLEKTPEDPDKDVDETNGRSQTLDRDLKDASDGKSDLSSIHNEGSEELENFFNSSQSNFSSSASSSPSKVLSRGRPKSARNQMKVLITTASSCSRQIAGSPCSSEDSMRAVVFDNQDNSFLLSESSSSYYNLRPGVSSHHPLPPGVQPYPLRVTKSPVHSRPISARRSRESSPRSSEGVSGVRPASAGVLESTTVSGTPRTTLFSRSCSVVRKSVEIDVSQAVSPEGGEEGGDASGAKPALSSSNRGINRVLSSKEKSSKGPETPPKPRPKSAFTQPKIMGRVGPTPSARIQPRHRPLGDYSRSLQMLGVKVPAPPAKAPRTPRSSSSQSWQSEGKLHTRVTRRSTSLEDVTRAIPQVKDPQALRDLKVGVDEAQRATLSQAIYEEWYFRRCKQIRSRRIRAKQKVQEEQRTRDMIQREKEEKVGVAVAAWEEQKVEKRKMEKAKIKEEESKKEDEVKEKDEQQMKVTAAVIAWETEKIELNKKKKEKKRQEREVLREKEREMIEKREEAEIVFLSWKEMKKYEEKEKRRKKREEEEERKRKEEEDWKEKREVADLAFAAWRKKKVYEEGQNLKKVYVSSEMTAVSEARKRLHRSSEALQAYEDWLDKVEEKELVKSYSNSRAAVLQANRRPWWPGGTHNSLMGSC